MKKIIINADDFGYSTAVNLGIIEAYKKGVLTSATLMANMPGCDEAIELAKNNPGLGVGGHLVLTCGAPLTPNSSLTDANGNFFSLKDYAIFRSQMDEEAIFLEWCNQIDTLISKGLTLTHLDSHHHVHTFPENYAITKRIAEKYRLCFRNAYELEAHVALPYQKGISGFLDLMNYQEIRDLNFAVKTRQAQCLEEIEAVLALAQEDEVTELMVHPAFVDETLYFNSSFNIQRAKEVSLLCDPKLRVLLAKYQVELYHYGEFVTALSN